MKRLASMAMLGVAALVAAGCPGTLSNPDAFNDAGTEIDDADTIFEQSCARLGCHDNMTMAAGLVLVPPVEEEVVGVPSTGAACTDRFLVVPGDPADSYLFELILGIGICHEQMPLLADPLDNDEVEVIRQWIIDLGASGTETMDGG